MVPVGMVPGITLERTDTTIDLSQEAKSSEEEKSKREES